MSDNPYSLPVKWAQLAAAVLVIANGVQEANLSASVREKLNRAAATAANVATAISGMNSTEKAAVLSALDAYSKPGGGIPKADLSSAVQALLTLAGTAYQKPEGGVGMTDLSAAVQALLGKASSAVQPAGLLPLMDANASNLVRSITGRENRGVTFTANGASCSCVGTATDFDATCTVFNTTGAMPAGLEAGKSYALDFSVSSNIPTNKLKLVVTLRGAGVSNTYPANTTTTLTLPANTTGINMYLLVSNGDEVDCTATVTIMNAKSNRALEDDMAELAANIATLGASVQATRQSVDGLNARNACNQIQVPAEGSTTYGVTFAPVGGTERIAYSGTATGTAKFNLIDSQAAMPEGFEAGKISHITFLAADAEGYTAMQLRVEQYRSGGHSTSTYSPNTEGGIDLAVNSNTIGIVMYLYVANGSHVNGSCTVELLNTATNQQLVAEDARLAGQVSSLQSAFSYQSLQIAKETGNRLDFREYVNGKNYAGSTAAYRAMSGFYLIAQSGVSVVSDGDLPLGVKICVYSQQALASANLIGRIGGNSWLTSLNHSSDNSDFIGGYLCLEFNEPNSAAITDAVLEATLAKIAIYDGTASRPWRPAVQAVDYDARAAAAQALNAANSTKVLRIGTNNVGQFRYGAGSGEIAADVVDKYRRALAAVGLDILFTQEELTDLGGSRTSSDVFSPFFLHSCHIVENSGMNMSVWSNFPIEEYGQAYLSDNRKYLRAVINVDGTLIEAFVIHFTTNWLPASGFDRSIEIRDHAALMAADDGYAIKISGGDGNFGLARQNVPLPEDEIAVYTAAGCKVINGDLVPFFPTNGQSPLDNLFAYGENVVWRKVDTPIPRAHVLSDHMLLVAELEVKPDVS